MTRTTLRTSFKVKGQGYRPTNADTQMSHQSWNRVTGHRVSDYGRVGSGLGSELYL